MSSTQLTVPHVRARRAGAARATSGALWEQRERVVTGVLIALGVVLIVIAWFGASDSTDWDTQTRWTAFAIVGVVVVCVAVGVYLFRGFSRVRAEVLYVRRQVAARLVPATGDVIRSGGDRVTVAGMAHHHRPTCLLVAGKTTVPATDDLPPCGVCG